MKPSPRKASERVTRSRGAALVDPKSPRKTRSGKEIPQPEESPEEESTPLTRTTRRKSVAESIMEIPKSVERRSTRRTKSLATDATVEDTIAEESEVNHVAEDKNSNKSETEENLKSQSQKSKDKASSDSADEKPATRATRRTRTSAVVEVPDLATIDETVKTRGSRRSKVNNDVETKAVEEEAKVEVMGRTRRSRKSEASAEMGSASSGVEKGEVEGKPKEASVVDGVSEPSTEGKESPEISVVLEKKTKSPRTPKKVVIDDDDIGKSKKSLDGAEAAQEKGTDINMNEKIVLEGADKPEGEGIGQAPAKEREVGESEIIDFISSCRQESDAQAPSKESVPEEVKTPKKTPKKQKGRLSTDVVSIEEGVADKESESKESVEPMSEGAKISKNPEKQGSKPSAGDVTEVSKDAEVGENKLPGSEMSEGGQVDELTTSDVRTDDAVLQSGVNSEDIAVSESPKSPRKRRKSKTPKKNSDVTESSEQSFRVSVFDTPASSPGEVVLVKPPSEPTEGVPGLQTPQKGVECLETPKSLKKAAESTSEEAVKDTKSPKSAKKTTKKPDNVPANDEAPVAELVEKDPEAGSNESEGAGPTKTPKKTPRKGKSKSLAGDSVDNQKTDSNKSEAVDSLKTPQKLEAEVTIGEMVEKQEIDAKKPDETPTKEVEPSKTPKKTPKKRKSELPAGESVTEQEPEKPDKTENVEPSKTPKKTPKKQKSELPTEELVIEQEPEKPDETSTTEIQSSPTPKKTPKKKRKSEHPAGESVIEQEPEKPDETQIKNVEPSKTPKKTPKKQNSGLPTGESVIEQEWEKPDETSSTKVEPSKTPKKTPKKRKSELPAGESVNEQEPEKPDETPTENVEQSKTPKKTPKKRKSKASAGVEDSAEVPKSEDVAKTIPEIVIQPEAPKKSPSKQDSLSINDEMVKQLDPEIKESDVTILEEAESTKTPKKTPKKRKKKSKHSGDEESVVELVDEQQPESKISDEVIPIEAEPSKTPKKTPQKQGSEIVSEKAVDNQEPESVESIPEGAEPSKTPKKTPRKRRRTKSLVEVIDLAAETPADPQGESAPEIVDVVVCDVAEETTGSEQVMESPGFTKVKSPEAQQNETDCDITFIPISKTLLDQKNKKSPVIQPKQVEKSTPKTDIDNPIVIEDNPIVIDDDSGDELKNLELLKLVKKLKKRKKLLKALGTKENGKKPKKAKEEITEITDLIEDEDATVENDEPVEEEAVETGLTNELPSESVTKKKRKRNRKKKGLLREISELAAESTENGDVSIIEEEAVTEEKGSLSKKKKRKLTLKSGTLELSEKSLEKSETAVNDTGVKKKSKKHKQKNAECDDAPNVKKPKLDTNMTPGLIYSTSLPVSVDTIDLQNVFLEKNINLLSLRRQNGKSEIVIENTAQIGEAMSLIAQHYFGGHPVRFEKYTPNTKNEGITDDDGFRFCQLYVTQIAPHITEKDLHALFPKAIRVDLPKHKSGVNKGCCILTFPDRKTTREHLVWNKKVNLAGYKLGISARRQDSSKGLYGNLLKTMLVHITDLDSAFFVKDLPKGLNKYTLENVFPQVLNIHVDNRKKEIGAIVVCKNSDQAEEFLSKEILWEGQPLTLEKTTRDSLNAATRYDGESMRKPNAYEHSTIVVSDLPEKTKEEEITALFPSCVLVNLVAKRKYALVGFYTRAEMLQILKEQKGNLEIRGQPVSLKKYTKIRTDLIESDEDFNKLLHVRGFPTGTPRTDLQAVFKNCQISMTKTNGVSYAIVKCKNGKRAKEYFSKKNLVVHGKILKIRYLQSILKQMKQEAEL